MNKTISNLKTLNKKIILIGFQGCKQKHLTPYKNMYSEFGFKHIKPIYPKYLENYDVRQVQPLGRTIYNDIIKNDKTIIHCMSGGMYPLSYTIKYLIWSNNLHKIDSIILDSSPVLSSHESLINALTIHYNITYLKPIIDVILKLYYRKIFLEIDTWTYDFDFLMNSKQFNTPKLFIHSKNDIISPSNYITSIFDSHNNHGNITEQLLLENSEHTKHILSNELKYKETILNFINKN